MLEGARHLQRKRAVLSLLMVRAPVATVRCVAAVARLMAVSD
eukprot:CAMPEP_0185168356 /NCGR_PEP_ID=MMETSP1139-20130426/15698_1 /TAXON_ID=298111 /ORGANISM="Pavlova sp., Strain CCMP459" /LENGTH=41 /DNA_ID= /DNA_START= /DNA_END= /DNA_ORIENTATION=